MKLIVTGIVWDTDGEKVKLPQEVTIDNPTEEMLEDLDVYADAICDYLTDKYGWCVVGFHVTKED